MKFFKVSCKIIPIKVLLLQLKRMQFLKKYTIKMSHWFKFYFTFAYLLILSATLNHYYELVLSSSLPLRCLTFFLRQAALWKGLGHLKALYMCILINNIPFERSVFLWKVWILYNKTEKNKNYHLKSVLGIFWQNFSIL